MLPEAFTGIAGPGQPTLAGTLPPTSPKATRFTGNQTGNTAHDGVSTTSTGSRTEP